ncbi:hypothetical protein ACFSUK_21480 [Sphingobium scionense]
MDDKTIDPRFGVVGKQKIQDTGPLTIERMKTIDATFIDASLDFVNRAKVPESPGSSGSTPAACTCSSILATKTAIWHRMRQWPTISMDRA